MNSADRPERTKRLTVFNHKGGVGKTTLTVNIAAALGQLGKRVLLVDADPQCNMTSYLVADEVLDDLLDKSDGPHGATLWSALKPVSEASGTFTRIRPIETNIDNVFLIPGDIRLSEFENDLTEFWGQCLQRKVKGFRGTTALSQLIGTISSSLKIDYVFYDCGPNIGPLNRAVLLDCDYFIVPVACDLFSLRALKTLGRTLVDWIGAWSTISDLAPAGTYLLPGSPKLIGYVPEGFRLYKGEVIAEHSHFLSKIEREMFSQVVAVLRGLDPKLAPSGQQFRLGEIRHYGALVPASQRTGVPLLEVNAGSQRQRNSAQRSFQSLAKKIDAKVRTSSK